MKIYVLTWGCYDDHKVCGVTDSLQVAKEWEALDNEHNGYEELVLNAAPLPVDHSFKHKH